MQPNRSSPSESKQKRQQRRGHGAEEVPRLQVEEFSLILGEDELTLAELRWCTGASNRDLAGCDGRRRLLPAQMRVGAKEGLEPQGDGRQHLARLAGRCPVDGA